METPKAKFNLGKILITPGALEALRHADDQGFKYLFRHACGDWGDVWAGDREENDLSMTEGFRLLSVYKLPDQTKIWIITEADRSATTILLPDEY